jgi:tryptophan synthase alpha chain
MTSVGAYLDRLKSYQLKNPVLVGFGIKDKQSFEEACMHANGAIIGTAFIKALENATDLRTATADFIKKIIS